MGNQSIKTAAIFARRCGASAYLAHGMAIVSDNSPGGMVDIHDRRPVVLPPALAREWAHPATTTALAREIIAAALPSDAFRWHKVRSEVGNSKYQMADATKAIA